MGARAAIQEIIDLDQKIAEVRDRFLQFPEQEQRDVLVNFYREIMEETNEDADMPLPLLRIAELLTAYPGEQTALVLSDGLGHANPDVRMVSGDALTHLAADGLDVIMPAVDDALAKGDVRAEEMPFVLSDIDDPDVPRVLERFLELESADAVAAAIEALADVGDTGSIKALQKLRKDKRVVVIENDVEESESTIGQLADDAIEMINESRD